MKQKDLFLYKGETNSLLLFEGEQIYNSSGKKNQPCFCTYYLEGYQLMIDSLMIRCGTDFPFIYNNPPSEIHEIGSIRFIEYKGLMEPVAYSGGIVIGREFVYDFGFTEDYPCFCYRNVMELIFQDGRLVTSIDHQKTMIRIRKNLKLGLRSLKKGKDSRCIRQYIKHSLVGHYSDSFLRKSMKLAKRKVKSITMREKNDESFLI